MIDYLKLFFSIVTEYQTAFDNSLSLMENFEFMFRAINRKVARSRVLPMQFCICKLQPYINTHQLEKRFIIVYLPARINMQMFI